MLVWREEVPGGAEYRVYCDEVNFRVDYLGTNFLYGVGWHPDRPFVCWRDDFIVRRHGMGRSLKGSRYPLELWLKILRMVPRDSAARSPTADVVRGFLGSPEFGGLRLGRSEYDWSEPWNGLRPVYATRDDQVGFSLMYNLSLVWGQLNYVICSSRAERRIWLAAGRRPVDVRELKLWLSPDCGSVFQQGCDAHLRPLKVRSLSLIGCVFRGDRGLWLPLGV